MLYFYVFNTFCLFLFFFLQPRSRYSETTDYSRPIDSSIEDRRERTNSFVSGHKTMRKLPRRLLDCFSERISPRNNIPYANRVTSVYIVITFRYRYIVGISNARLVVIEIG